MAWTLRLPDELEARLEGHCRDTAASKHGTVVLALEEWLDGHALTGRGAVLEGSERPHVTASASGVGNDPGAASRPVSASAGKPFNGPDPRVKP